MTGSSIREGGFVYSLSLRGCTSSERGRRGGRGDIGEECAAERDCSYLDGLGSRQHSDKKRG